MVTQTELSAEFDGQNSLVVAATPSSPSYKIAPPSQSREESNVSPASAESFSYGNEHKWAAVLRETVAFSRGCFNLLKTDDCELQ